MFPNIEFRNRLDKFYKIYYCHSKKVYRTTLNRSTISEHPEPNYYCFPSASEEFNGEEGKFLTIANDVYCIAK